jgi:hypothetical protein
MAFNNAVYLISGGVTYYLSGSTTNYYAGSGAPWTAENTSPYRLSLNDGSPIWVPQPSLIQAIYGGGPPLRNGRTLLDRSRDDVTEQIGIQMYGTTADNAITLLQQLRKILNTALYSVPCVLAIQSGTNTAYFEIAHADVVETASYLTLGGTAQNEIRATITWRRSFAGTRLSSGETLINAAAFGNVGTGSPDNIVSYSTGAGDLIYEGQPLNIQFLPDSTANRALSRLYLASIYSRTYSTVAGAPFSTTSTTGANLYTHSAWTITDMLTRQGLKPRTVLRCSSAPSSNLQLRLVAYFSSSAVPFYTGPWFTPPASSWYVDMGKFPTEMIRQSKGLTSVSVVVRLQGRSTDGLSASISPTYIEQILYYDWCRLDQGTERLLAMDGTNYLLIDTFAEQTDAVCLPHRTGQAFAVLAGSPADEVWTPRGRLPRYFSGASLYAAWLDQSTGIAGEHQHQTARTATATVTHAPLWLTLRGAN